MRAKGLGDVYAELAFQHREKNRHDVAIEAYRQALDFNPDDRLARISLGWLFYNQDRWSEAIDQHRFALEQEVDADAQFALGLAYLANGNYNQRRRSMQRESDSLGGPKHRGSVHCKI